MRHWDFADWTFFIAIIAIVAMFLFGGYALWWNCTPHLVDRPGVRIEVTSQGDGKVVRTYRPASTLVRSNTSVHFIDSETGKPVTIYGSFVIIYE